MPSPLPNKCTESESDTLNAYMYVVMYFAGYVELYTYFVHIGDKMYNVGTYHIYYK